MQPVSTSNPKLVTLQPEGWCANTQPRGRKDAADSAGPPWPVTLLVGTSCTSTSTRVLKPGARLSQTRGMWLLRQASFCIELESWGGLLGSSLTHVWFEILGPGRGTVWEAQSFPTPFPSWGMAWLWAGLSDWCFRGCGKQPLLLAPLLICAMGPS